MRHTRRAAELLEPAQQPGEAEWRRRALGGAMLARHLAHEHREANQHARTSGMRRCHDGAMTVELRQIQKTPMQPLPPLRDALARNTVPTCNLFECITALRFGHRLEDVFDIVGLAGHSLHWKRALTPFAVAAADQPDRDRVVALRRL